MRTGAGILSRCMSPLLVLGVVLALDATGIAAQQERAGASRLVGTVVESESGAPVEGVAITLPGAGRQALTNAEGRFAFLDLPPATYRLRAHHLAYGSFTSEVEVPFRSTVDVEIRLAIDPVELEPIQVTVRQVRDQRLETKGFYERREWGERLGLGHYFDREDIERRNPVLISQMVADVPSVRLDCSRSYRSRTCELRSARTSPLACRRMNLYVDGILVLDAMEPDSGWTMSLDEFVSPSDVGAVEVYTSMAELPAQFGDVTVRCGAVVVWTRSGG